MRQTLVRVAAVALLASASAFAADLDANEKKWVQQCVDNLVAKSALIRSSAERAISGLGQDALPAVVAATGKLKTDADWLALSRAIAGMGPGARKTLDGLRMSWPKGTETRFADMLSFLDKAEEEAKKNGPVAIPASPGSVAARVRQILDGYRNKRVMSQEDPEIKELVSLGHDAVGTLLAYLDEEENVAEGPQSGAYAAQNALAKLVDASDTPALVAMLRKGRTKVAQALKGADAPEVLDAFVEAIEKSFIDSDLVHALEPRGKEPRIQKALIVWLRKPAALEREYVVWQVAEVLQRNDAPGAAACLLPLLPQLNDLQPRQKLALALARLGEKSAIPVLIDVLTMSDSHGPRRFDYPRHESGLALNEITGTTIYTGYLVEGSGGFSGEPRYVADWAATSKAFREWWAANKDKLRFDPETHAWSVK